MKYKTEAQIQQEAWNQRLQEQQYSRRIAGFNEMVEQNKKYTQMLAAIDGLNILSTTKSKTKPSRSPNAVTSVTHSISIPMRKSSSATSNSSNTDRMGAIDGLLQLKATKTRQQRMLQQQQPRAMTSRNNRPELGFYTEISSNSNSNSNTGDTGRRVNKKQRKQ